MAGAEGMADRRRATGHLAVNATHVDGKVWIKNSDETNIYRLDVATGKFEDLGNQKDPFNGRRIGTYGIHSDSQNNADLLDFSSNNLVRIDAKTKALKFYDATEMSRPRRGRVDSQDRLWFAEYGGNAIGMLDPKSGEIKEWKVPTAWSAPYDAMLDAHGDAWTARSDRPRRAAGHQDRSVHGISSAAADQYPPRVRGLAHEARHALDRQQPRRFDRQGRTAELS